MASSLHPVRKTEWGTPRRRLASDELQLYRQIFAYSSDGIAIIDKDGRYLEQNAAHRELTGYSDEELAGQTPAIHLGEDAFASLAEELRRSGNFRGTVVSRPKSGPAKLLDLSAFAVRDSRGEVMCYVGIKRDVTEQRRAEVERDARLRELESICHLSRALNRATSLDEIYAAAIGALIHSTGADRASVLLFDGEGVMRFKAWHRLSDQYRAAVEGHSPWNPETRNPLPVTVEDVSRDPQLAKYGDIFAREGIGALGFIPVVYEERLLGKFMIYFDRPHVFTESELQMAEALAAHIASAIHRRQAEEALWASERQAAAGRLAATVAHEINNPLEAVTNLAYLLRGSVAHNPTATRYLQELEDELLRVAAITKKTLGFYRDSGGPQQLDLGEVVTEVCALFRAKFEAKKVRLEAIAEAPAQVTAYRGELRQVISNLITNALEASDGGVVRLGTTRAAGEVLLTIADTGRGIPPEHLGRVFEPFFTTKPGLGTGLGLAISKQIIEKHRGTIRVTSSTAAEDHGTTFEIRLPA